MKLLVLCLGICVSIPSTPTQAQWQQRALNGTAVHGLLTDGVFSYAGTEASGFYLSTDDGATWTQQNNGLTNNFVKTFAIRGSNLFAGTNGPAGVYLTTNNGGNWTIVNSGITNTSIHALEFNGTILLAASNGGGVFQSTNNGSTWLASNNGLTSLPVHALLVVGNRVFAGADGGVFVSTNNGANWSLPATSPVNLRSLATTGSNIFAAANGTGIFKSTDNGDTWSAVNNGITNLAARTVIARNGNLFAGTQSNVAQNGGVHLSTDNGDSWAQINTGLTNLSILSLAANSTTLYAGTQTAGIWTRPLAQVVVAVNEEQPGQPTGFTLDQNYPNPFNPATRIGFQISDFGFVSLKVFDVLGDEVATLVNGTVEAGVHVVPFDARNLASGFYTYRLTTGNTSITKTMLLLK